MPADEKARAGDIVLDNGGTLAELEGLVDRLWADLRQRAERRPG
jgi:dephospho-CoA kinase